MSWQDEAVSMVRFAIGDFTQPYAYCDTRLLDLFLYGAKLTVNDIAFPEEYSVTLSTSVISPTPEDDSPLLVLASLKTAYIIANSEFKARAAGAVTITDGPSTISLSGSVSAFKDRVNRLLDDYEKAKTNFILGNGIGIRAVLTPTISPYYQNVDYRR